MRNPLAATLSVLLLAGCASPTEQLDPSPDAGRGDAASAPAAQGFLAVGPRSWSRSGQSSGTVLGACPPAGTDGCVGFFSVEFGEASVPFRASRGFLNVTWTPKAEVLPSLRVSLYAGENNALVAEATGPSPLSIPLEDVRPDVHRVAFLFEGQAGAVVQQEVAWTLELRE